mgnify:CR=1 FL=1
MKIIFSFFIVGLERYEPSESILEQFIELKNELLINTLVPIVSLNLSLDIINENILSLHMVELT